MKKQKILIWGTAARGERTYELLKEHRRYEIAAFGDNNRELWGSRKHGQPVIGADELQTETGIGGIVIASSKMEEIRIQLSQLISIPIYGCVDELMFERIAIDISGCCNAKCRYCVTGVKNRHQEFCLHVMSYEAFVQLYEHLYQSHIIETATEIMLYSWGEPFLNPDYVPIVEYLAEKGQRFSVSTNASAVKRVSRTDAYRNCCAFIFSMPGFSQESYDRIHGFSFEQIRKNITEINQDLRENGFAGEGSISFHVYRFNTSELGQAKQFAETQGLRFHPYYPYFNGNSMTQAYLEGSMDPAVREEAQRELFLSHVEALIQERPRDYRCFLEDIISIDCDGRLVLCCASDDGCMDHIWGSALDVGSFEDMKKLRREMLKCSSCQTCRRLGIDYWMGNNPAYQDTEKENRQDEK